MAAVFEELGIMLGLAVESGVASVVDVVGLEGAAVVGRGLGARDDSGGDDGRCEDDEEKSGEHWVRRGTRTRVIYTTGTHPLFVPEKLETIRKGIQCGEKRVSSAVMLTVLTVLVEVLLVVVVVAGEEN